ncbi:MAG TPA: hypothetical protein VE861_05970 [Gemmatimonadaceae bacterium]|nr:hypothetical protein [Gemmatimonadaceae bacterium]
MFADTVGRSGAVGASEHATTIVSALLASSHRPIVFVRMKVDLLPGAITCDVRFPGAACIASAMTHD